MSLPHVSRVPAAFLRHSRPAAHTARSLCTPTITTTSASPTPPPPPPSRNDAKHFVRIAGPASYASRLDVAHFLQSNGIPSTEQTDLVQGFSDVYQNQAVWVYDAGSPSAADDAASRLTGRVAGLKLVRAAAVDQRVVDEMLAVPAPRGKVTLRKRMNVIRPEREERGRALLATGLKPDLAPRALWGFFAAFEVVDVKHLRRSGVASIVFATEAEAWRALRERGNLPMQRDQQLLGLKMHE